MFLIIPVATVMRAALVLSLIFGVAAADNADDLLSNLISDLGPYVLSSSQQP